MESDKDIVTQMSRKAETYPADWSKGTRKLWTGVIFTEILIVLVIIFIMLFPQQGDIQTTVARYGVVSLWVYFLLFAMTALASFMQYYKGLTRFGTLIGKEGQRSTRWVQVGFLTGAVGIVLHFMLFYLPLLSASEKGEELTLLLGNSILLIATLINIIGFILMGTAEKCPQPSRRGTRYMIVASVVLLAGSILSSFVPNGKLINKIVTGVVLLLGSILFCYSWNRIIKMEVEEED